MSIALLIVDMQKGLYELEGCKGSFDSAMEYINETSRFFREAEKPVILIQDEETGEGPGSIGYELLDELLVAQSDISISKVHSNAFWQTELDEKLKALGIKFVVVCGFAAEHCVLFTLNGAMERGYGASLLQHGIAGFDKQVVKETQYLRPTMSYESLYYVLLGS